MRLNEAILSLIDSSISSLSLIQATFQRVSKWGPLSFPMNHDIDYWMPYTNYSTSNADVDPTTNMHTNANPSTSTTTTIYYILYTICIYILYYTTIYYTTIYYILY